MGLLSLSAWLFIKCENRVRTGSVIGARHAVPFVPTRVSTYLSICWKIWQMFSTVRTEVILMRPVPAPMLKITAAQRTAVATALRRRDLTPRLRERLEMVKAATLSQDVAVIAQWSGRTPETVRRWLAAYQ